MKSLEHKYSQHPWLTGSTQVLFLLEKLPTRLGLIRAKETLPLQTLCRDQFRCWHFWNKWKYTHTCKAKLKKLIRKFQNFQKDQIPSPWFWLLPWTHPSSIQCIIMHHRVKSQEGNIFIYIYIYIYICIFIFVFLIYAIFLELCKGK